MRTEGTFDNVFMAVHDYYEGITDDRPIDAVIRRENGVWKFESGLDPRHDDIDFECTYDDFTAWWHDDLMSMPFDDEHIDDFINEMNRLD